MTRNQFVTLAAVAVAASGATGARGQAPADAVRAVEERTSEFVLAWSDDLPVFVAPFYDRDAVLVQPGGVVLEGRDMIMREFLRPNVARVRGLRLTYSKTVGAGDLVTAVAAFSARLAPHSDTVRASLSNTWARQADGSWLIVASTFELPNEVASSKVASRHFISDSLRLHYLDFGGEGVPVVFIPSGDRTAYTYIDFAMRFVDHHRVLALTSRGSGQSEGEASERSPAVIARDVIALLDSLAIERAVIVDRWADVPVYLGEQHPDRLAGLVILRAVPPEPDPRALEAQDPTGLVELYNRAGASITGLASQHSLRYVPRYLHTDSSISVPTLMFLIESSTPRAEVEWDFRRSLGDVAAILPDSVSREVTAYFQRLAVDQELNDSLEAFYRNVFLPQWSAAEQAFFRAFGSHRLVRLEGEDPRNYYQYRDSPDLIYPHIQDFLAEIRARIEPR